MVRTALLQRIDKSYCGILPINLQVEIDRIISHEQGGFTMQLRVRNNTPRPIKINAFILAEFVIPKKVEKVLEHGWLQCSDVSYKSLDTPTRESRVFLQRDQNHFSFNKDYGYLDGSVISEWFSVIKLKGDDLLIGAVTTADQFSQIFIRKDESGTRIRVTCQNDGLTLYPGEVIKSEKLFFAVGNEELIKRYFANSIAKNMGITCVASPIRAMCNSYYWHKNVINQDLINAELDALEALSVRPKLDYFQLDAGYTPYFGDWLDYKVRFPDGFGPIVSRIKNLGYKPAIWISPFAINPGTSLHDHHSSWFLKGIDHGHFDGRLTSPMDGMLNVTDLEVLDPTNEKVLDYIRYVLTHFKNLGFELFKIDFIYPVCLTNNFSKPVTRAQAIRQGISFIRKVLGKDVKILTGITQLSPVVGLADYVRTGIDSLNPFVCGIPGINTLVNDYMLQDNIEESRERSFLNGVVWRADPDVVIFRQGTGIDDKIIEEHKKFVKENNMSLWIGDSFARMDNKTKSAVVKFFNQN